MMSTNISYRSKCGLLQLFPSYKSDRSLFVCNVIAKESRSMLTSHVPRASAAVAVALAVAVLRVESSSSSTSSSGSIGDNGEA